MRSIFLAPLILLVAAMPAHASGSLSCQITDKTLELALDGAFSHGVGEGLMNAGGTLKITSDHVRTREVALDRERITQYWFTGRDLKLRIYFEPADEPHEEIDLVIEAKQDKPKNEDDEPGYSGTYALSLSRPDASGVSETKTIKGRVSCSAGY